MHVFPNLNADLEAQRSIPIALLDNLNRLIVLLLFFLVSNYDN